VKKFILSVVFVLALFGVRMVSASEIFLPIGSKETVDTYIRNQVSELWINLVVENPWKIIDMEGGPLDFTESDYEDICESWLPVMLERSGQEISKYPGATVSVKILGILRDGRPWSVLVHYRKIGIIKADGSLEVSGDALKVHFEPYPSVHVKLPGISSASITYTDGEVQKTLIPVAQDIYLAGAFKIDEAYDMLILPYDLSIGTYPGTLTLSFKDGSEQVFDLQPNRMVITRLERGMEQITLTLEGSGLFAVDVSTDLKTWTEAGVGAFDPEGPTIFQVACTKGNSAFYRLRGRSPEVVGSSSR